MDEPPAGAEQSAGHSHDATEGPPRWVKVFVIILAVVALLLIVGKLTGLGGEHGPGRHMGDARGAPALASTGSVFASG